MLALTLAAPAAAGCFKSPFPAGPWRSDAQAQHQIAAGLKVWGPFRISQPAVFCFGVGPKKLDANGETIAKTFDCNFASGPHSFSAVAWTAVVPKRFVGDSMQTSVTNIFLNGWFLVAGRC